MRVLYVNDVLGFYEGVNHWKGEFKDEITLYFISNVLYEPEHHVPCANLWRVVTVVTVLFYIVLYALCNVKGSTWLYTLQYQTVELNKCL